VQPGSGLVRTLLPAGTLARRPTALSVSADDRWISFFDTPSEGDVWLMTLE